jgi:hypothetical protein
MKTRMAKNGIYNLLIKVLFCFAGIMLISCRECTSQNLEHNLEKYWYYKNRLQSDFLVPDPLNRQGTNIPATRRYKDDGEVILKWGDATAHYYLMR